jgi:hypothetical protein
MHKLCGAAGVGGDTPNVGVGVEGSISDGGAPGGGPPKLLESGPSDSVGDAPGVGVNVGAIARGLGSEVSGVGIC